MRHLCKNCGPNVGFHDVRGTLFLLATWLRIVNDMRDDTNILLYCTLFHMHHVSVRIHITALDGLSLLQNILPFILT